MEIGNMFNLQHLNQVNNPFSSSPSGQGLRSGDPNAFEDLLRRTQAPVQSELALSSSRRTPQIDRSSELFELCLELETFLVKNLVSGMRNTIEKSNLIDTGFAGKIYEDMLFDEYAGKIARNAGFGLAEMAYMELTGQR
jgi:flagellar protein FlgJ